MKKRVIAILTVLAMITTVCSAGAVARWSYLNQIIPSFEITSSGIEWAITASAYPVSKVTDVKVSVELLAKTSTGYSKVDSDSSKESGFAASCGGTYKNVVRNSTYCLSVEIWIYNGNQIIENVGPQYFYYDT